MNISFSRLSRHPALHIVMAILTTSSVFVISAAATAQNAPAGDRQQAFAQGIEEVRQSGILEKALKQGDKAKDFTLPDAEGKEVSLSKLLEQGPVILTFYRGGWCPYCNRQLSGLQTAYPQITALGAQLVAVTPEVPEQVARTRERARAAYTMLSDKGNRVAREYGLVFRIADVVIPYYDQFFSIEEYNGDKTYELPLAASYVIAPDSTIRYAFLDADYKNRAEIDKLLEVLRSIKEGKPAEAPTAQASAAAGE